MTNQPDLKSVIKRIEAIEKRNEAVTLDKSWETSKSRKALLTLFTYIPLATYMWAIGVPDPLRNALVPTIGFLISTLSLPFFRKIWELRNISEH